MPTATTSRPATIRGLPRPLARHLEAYQDRLDIDRIKDAYALAHEAHAGQRRASGEDYVAHVVEVATIVAQLRLDTDSVVAALVHDTVEDTSVTLDQIRERFGSSAIGPATIATPEGGIRRKEAGARQWGPDADEASRRQLLD